jgi:hypothetical protein
VVADLIKKFPRKTVVHLVIFEILTAVTMKDTAPCRSCVNRRFGRTYVFDWWLSLQPPAHSGSSLADFSTLKMDAIRSSETLVHTRSTRRHIPEDGILPSGSPCSQKRNIKTLAQDG